MHVGGLDSVRKWRASGDSTHGNRPSVGSVCQQAARVGEANDRCWMRVRLSWWVVAYQPRCEVGGLGEEVMVMVRW